MPRRIYQDYPLWVRSLDGELNAIFNPAVNPFFKHGELCRWLLYSDTGEAIGRVAAFIDHEKASSYPVPSGGIGYFECIQDQAAAHLLFDTCMVWLLDRGMQGMIGPINFGENNQYWGLLVKAFDRMPYYGTQYHPEWYQELFTSYGFEVHFEQLSYRFELESSALSERIMKLAAYAAKRQGFTFEAFDPEQQDRFVDAFVTIYNEAFNFLDNFSPIDPEVVLKDFGKLKPIISNEAIIFAFQGKKPVGFIVSIPDINPIVQKMRGNSKLLGKLIFLWNRRKGMLDRLRIAHFGVVEDMQRKGVEAGLATAMYQFLVSQDKYKEIELSWIGSFNPKMIKFMESLGAPPYKKHWTMIKKFDI